MKHDPVRATATGSANSPTLTRGRHDDRRHCKRSNRRLAAVDVGILRCYKNTTTCRQHSYSRATFMISNLPEPHHDRLPAAPLELAVWQLQFTEPADVQDPAIGTGVAEALAGDGRGSFQLNRLIAPTVSIGFGPAGPLPPTTPEQPEIDGWQLRRGQLVVNVARAAISVETTAYDGWPEFRATVEALCVRLAELIDVPAEQRLGLRYVDRILVPRVQRPADWDGLLAPWLTAPLVHEQLGDAVLANSGQLELAVSDDVQTTIRHRAFPDFDRRGRQTVILDYDTFRQGYRPFSAGAAVETSDRFNDISHRLFEASITPELYAVFARENDSSE